MSWYAAHVVMYFKYKEHPQDDFFLYENIFLVQAATVKEAWEKAERLGREDESHDETLRCDGKPAALVFAGVRQVVLSVDPEERPDDGTEISYSELEVDSLEALQQFVQGKPVSVRYAGLDAVEEGTAPVG